MDLTIHLRRMAENSLWSNDRLYRAVLALRPGEFEAERTSFFPSIKETLNHILSVDLYYLDMLEEGGRGLRRLRRFRGVRRPGRARRGAGPFRPPAARFLRSAAASRSRPSRRHRPRRGRAGARDDRRSPGASLPAPDPPSRPGPRHAVGQLGGAAAARRVLPRLRCRPAAGGGGPPRASGMNPGPRCKVAIVGAGPVGLALAIDCALRGVFRLWSSTTMIRVETGQPRDLLVEAQPGDLRPPGRRLAHAGQGRHLEGRASLPRRRRAVELRPAARARSSDAGFRQSPAALCRAVPRRARRANSPG